MKALLTEEQMQSVLALAKDASAWVDGRDGEKRCMFLDRAAADGQRVAQIVLKAVAEHKEFQQAALPAKITTPMLVRYQTGDGYGPHIDAARMGNLRCDLACTVWIDDKYSGGELVVDGNAIDSDEGFAHLYPAGSVHEVRRVTSGTRYVVVFWIQSLVRNNEHRALLGQYMRALWKVEDKQAALELSGVYHNMYRMWSE